MGFFNSNFLHERRVQWKNAIAKFQYRVEGTWYDAIINSSGVEITKVVYSVIIPTVPATSHIITGIRLLDADGNEAAMQELSIERSSVQSLLISFSFPIQEV